MDRHEPVLALGQEQAGSDGIDRQVGVGEACELAEVQKTLLGVGIGTVMNAGDIRTAGEPRRRRPPPVEGLRRV